MVGGWLVLAGIPLALWGDGHSAALLPVLPALAVLASPRLAPLCGRGGRDLRLVLDGLVVLDRVPILVDGVLPVLLTVLDESEVHSHLAHRSGHVAVLLLAVS